MGSPKKDKVFFGGIISGLPKIFFFEKHFWEKGEKALSCQSHGVALTAFELGNGALYAPFPDRARALPRETAGVVSVAVAVKQLPAKCAHNRAPKKRQSIFLGKGGTDVISEAFAEWRRPTKNVAFRRGGAADRGRTDTVSLPSDFESDASANSTTAAYYPLIISHKGSKIKRFPPFSCKISPRVIQ